MLTFAYMVGGWVWQDAYIIKKQKIIQKSSETSIDNRLQYLFYVPTYIILKFPSLDTFKLPLYIEVIPTSEEVHRVKEVKATSIMQKFLKKLTL